MKRKSEHGQGELNGFLDTGSHIRGELLFEDTFRIDGRLTGTVVSRGDLVVGDAGEVEGDIQVNRVFVSGTVRGTIVARSRLEVTSSGKVKADVDTPSLVVEEGAFCEGRCTMARPDRDTGTLEGGRQAKVAHMPLPKDSRS